MKKLICLLLVFMLLPSLPAYSAGTGFSGALDVPYDVTYELIVHDSFKIDTMHDLERLLYFVEKLHIEQIMLYPPTSLYDAALARVNEFLQEHDGDEVWFTYPPDEYNMTDEYFKFGLFWSDVHSLKMFQLPVISSTEELYREVLKCSNHKNWRKAYRLADNYATAIDIKNNDMDIAATEILEEYGVDVSEKIEYHAWEQAVYHQATGAYILGIENKHFDEVDEEEMLARYNRILKNNVVIPITDDMTEAEKLRILAQSTGNVLNSYEITNYNGKELPYSVGVGQCAHYSDVFYDLCKLYGIECIEVHGDISGVAHSWNAVKYGGNWYYVDTTSTTVENREIPVDFMSLALLSAEDIKNRGYGLIGNHPDCTSESIIWNWEDFSLDPVFPDTVEKYEMFTPYRAYNPMTTGPMIYYNIYFEKKTGKIWAIDTNLSSDTWFKDESGNVSKKETTLEIPSEIDGVTVKIIGSNLDAYFNIPYYDNIIIPSDITLEHHAFYKVGHTQKTNVIIGSRADIGIGALPTYHTLSLGSNYIFRGFDAASGNYQKGDKFEYYDDVDGVVLYHCDDEVLTVPSGYSHALFGCGNNISDHTPTKTLVINKDIKYVDPRLNHLNRNFSVNADNPYYTSENGVLYNKDKTALISVPIGISNFVIPDSVKEVGEYAFAYCNEIKNIVIPENIEKVGYRAFWHLSNIQNICLEGETPEGFAVTLSGNPNVFKASESEKVVLNHTCDGNLIIIPSVTRGTPTVAFFDIYDNLIAIKRGNNIKIPPLGKSYKVFTWYNLSPEAIVEYGEF